MLILLISFFFVVLIAPKKESDQSNLLITTIITIMKRLLLFSLIAISLFSAQAQKHTLPKHLEYQALEPGLDSLSMYIHINSYHKKYVELLNKSLTGTADTGATITQLLIHSSKLSDMARNAAGGHYNHTLFWDILSPTPAAKPSELLNTEITKSFMGMDSMKVQILQAANKVFGSGWVWVIVTPEKKLKITTTINEENPLMEKHGNVRGMPILGIDLWEHAYYTKYQGNKKEYIQAVFKLLDWELISRKYSVAMESEALKQLNSSADWAAFSKFHDVMKGLVMNMGKGEMTPIKSNSANLLTLAKALESEPIPAEYATEPVKAAIKNLILACAQVNDVVVKKGTDAQIKEKFATIRDPHKVIVASLSKKEDQFSHQ